MCGTKIICQEYFWLQVVEKSTRKLGAIFLYRMRSWRWKLLVLTERLSEVKLGFS